MQREKIFYYTKSTLERTWWQDRKISLTLVYFFNFEKLRYTKYNVWLWFTLLKRRCRDFPGSPVGKTLCFTAGGKGSNSGRATEIPHAAQHKTATKRWTLVKTSPQRWLTCSLLSTFFSLGSGTGFSGGTVSRSLQTFAWERRQERAVINLHLGQKEPDHLGFLRASITSLATGMMAQTTQGTLGKDQLPPGPSQALPTFLFMFYAFLLQQTTEQFHRIQTFFKMAHVPLQYRMI